MLLVDEDNLDDVQPDPGQETVPADASPESGQPPKGKEPDGTAELAEDPKEALKKTQAELTRTQQLNATLKQRLDETEINRIPKPEAKPAIDYTTEMANIKGKLAKGEIDAGEAIDAQGKLMNAIREQDKAELRAEVQKKSKETSTYAERQIFLNNVEAANPEVEPYSNMIEGEVRALLAQGENWEDAVLKSVDKVKKLIGKPSKTEPPPKVAPNGSQAIMKQSSVAPPPKPDEPETTEDYIEKQKKMRTERRNARR